MRSETVYVEGVTVKAATAKALLCEVGGVKFWVPRSICRGGTTVTKPGDVGWLALPASFAAQKRIRRYCI